MSKHTLDNIYTFLLILPMLVPLWYALSVGRGSYRRRITGAEQVFRRPAAAAVCGILVLAWVFLVLRFPLTDRTAFLAFCRSLPSQPDALRTTAITCLAVAGLCVAAFSWYKSQYVLRLDRGRRTYRSYVLTKFLPRHRSGPWADIAGIAVTDRDLFRRGTFFFVQLLWYESDDPHESDDLYSDLGAFNTPGEAQAFAGQLSRDLGLPLTGAPL